MAGITLDHVTKRFGPVTAVDSLSLEIADEEFLVLLGPSGCGKTTALRIIAGLDSPTSGDVRIGGRSVTALSPKERDIAMVFQNYALYPHMSVADNMAFALKMSRMPSAEIARRVRAAAELLEITDLLDRKPRQLSGGQRQRVALARAIVREPRAFLMDEPLSNLDAQLRVHTRAELVKLQHRLRTTTVYVTHDQSEAMTMADRIAVLRNGLLQQVDTPQRIYDEPANRFVASFIGSPGMNFFEGRVVAGDKGLELDTVLFRLPLPAALAVRQEQSLVAGIRPEDLKPASTSPPPAAMTFTAQVDLVEPLGSEKLLHLSAARHAFVARVEPRLPATLGDSLPLAVDPARVHLFDSGTGERIG